MDFTQDQMERYSRHIILDDIGGIGQEKILKSKVLIVGAGGLGSPAALYLAAAGVGTLGIIDNDKVDLTNLQRQIIHFTGDIGKPKVESAREKINQLNPGVKVITYQDLMTSGNALGIIKEYDFIIDGTDNFPTKFLINDACVMEGIPYSHGGILRFEGQAMTFVPGNACFRCVFEDLPPKDSVPTCSQAGVLGAVAGILGTIQVAEAVKYIIGKGELLTNRFLIFDALEMDFRTVKIKRNPGCPVCGDNPEITKLQDFEQPDCDLNNN